MLNAVYHIFGEHKNCSKYFYKGIQENEINVVNDFKKSRLFYQIVSISTHLAQFADSIIHNVNNNAVERLNSLIAKKKLVEKKSIISTKIRIRLDVN